MRWARDPALLLHLDRRGWFAFLTTRDLARISSNPEKRLVGNRHRSYGNVAIGRMAIRS